MFLTINSWASPMLSTDCILVFKLYALIVFSLAQYCVKLIFNRL